MFPALRLTKSVQENDPLVLFWKALLVSVDEIIVPPLNTPAETVTLALTLIV